MLDIGFQELILILVIALLVFGPKKLPELGRAIGRAVREFRRATDEFRSTIETNLQINEPGPFSSPTVTTEPAMPTEAVESPSVSSVEPVPVSLPSPEAVTESPDLGEPYWARRGSPLFHTRECMWGKRIPEAERTYFKRLGEAKEQGLRTCPVCEPWEAE